MAISYVVREIGNSSLIWEWMSSRHYSNTCPRNSKHVFGLFDGDQMIGACLFGPLSRQQAGKKYLGCVELSRLFIEDCTPKNTESFFIGHCLRVLRRNGDHKGVVSYTDPNVGHRGTIYKASNFKLVGFTPRTHHYADADGNRVHSKGVWDRANKAGVKEKTQASREGLKRISDDPKIAFFYPLKKGFEITTKKTEQRVELTVKRFDFFSNWTRESAWVHGLLYGDGSFHNTDRGARVLLTGNAITVKRYNDLLEITKKPKTVGVNAITYETHFDSKVIVEWFHRRGIANKKSHILRWPSDLPDEFTWDFIRGLIDTDGSVVITRPKSNGGKGNDKLQLGFSSASREFCEQIRDKMGSSSKITENNKEMSGKIYTCYSFWIKTVPDAISMLERIYDCPSHIRNEERYLRFLEGKRLYALTQVGCKVCGRQIHSAGLCTEHMWAEKNALKPVFTCEGCGQCPGDTLRFCGACMYRHYRLMRNPSLATRKRRSK